MSGRSPRKKRLIAAAVIAEPILMKLRGYPMGGNIVVRCREGHLFTTLWLPAVSLKSVRLVWWRFQRCPVGDHWTIVSPVREAELSPAERRRARARHDIRLP
jgi:hypothetical protein